MLLWGFGTFDINGPAQSPAGVFYLSSLLEPGVELDGIDQFLADMQEDRISIRGTARIGQFLL